MLIAEIGINHNGDLDMVKRMILKAKKSNANYIKFQKRNVMQHIPENQKYKEKKNTPWGMVPYYVYKQNIELNFSDYYYIDSFCKKHNMEWFASVWDIDSLNFILNFDVPFIKVSSACITDLELLEEIAKTDKRVIFSTGMSTEAEIDTAYTILKNNKPIIMACTSTYPTQDNEINLKRIDKLKEKYPSNEIGFSSHSTDIMPATFAYAKGAKWIEQHVTLDKNMWGSDQKASISFEDLSKLSKFIAKIDVFEGTEDLKILESEKKIKEKLRLK